MTEGDAAFGQIVRGKFQGDPVSGQHADAIAAQPARQMGQYHPVLLQLYAE